MSLPTWVQTYPGVPPATLFSSTRGLGTPIIVDETTDTPYYLKAGVPTALAGGGGGGSALPVGSIFVTIDPTDPATTLGYGTWSLLGAGSVLVGVDASNPNWDTVLETGVRELETVAP